MTEYWAFASITSQVSLFSQSEISKNKQHAPRIQCCCSLWTFTNQHSIYVTPIYDHSSYDARENSLPSKNPGASRRPMSRAKSRGRSAVRLFFVVWLCRIRASNALTLLETAAFWKTVVKKLNFDFSAAEKHFTEFPFGLALARCEPKKKWNDAYTTPVRGRPGWLLPQRATGLGRLWPQRRHLMLERQETTEADGTQHWYNMIQSWFWSNYRPFIFLIKIKTDIHKKKCKNKNKIHVYYLFTNGIQWLYIKWHQFLEPRSGSGTAVTHPPSRSRASATKSSESSSWCWTYLGWVPPPLRKRFLVSKDPQDCETSKQK